ncbi:hypothetical protein Hanom_Chr04g00357411 [Helianthus anomalus]
MTNFQIIIRHINPIKHTLIRLNHVLISTGINNPIILKFKHTRTRTTNKTSSKTTSDRRLTSHIRFSLFTTRILSNKTQQLRNLLRSERHSSTNRI